MKEERQSNNKYNSSPVNFYNDIMKSLKPFLEDQLDDKIMRKE